MKSLSDLSDLDGEELEADIVPASTPDLIPPPDGPTADALLARYLDALSISREVRRAGKTALKTAMVTEALRDIPATVARIEETLGVLVAEKSQPPAEARAPIDSVGLAARLIGAMDALDALGALLERTGGQAEATAGAAGGACDRGDPIPPAADRPVPAGHALEGSGLVDARSIGSGLELVKGRLLTALGEVGVQRIGARGERFDPKFHEAVGHVFGDGPEGNVASEDLAGYTCDGHVLRFARVLVWRTAPARVRLAAADPQPLRPPGAVSVEVPALASAVAPTVAPAEPRLAKDPPTHSPSLLDWLWSRFRGQRTAPTGADTRRQ